MKDKIKRILFVTFNIAIVVGLLSLLGFSQKKLDDKICEERTIYIKSKNGNAFVDELDVHRILKSFDSSGFVGEGYVDIDILNLEQRITSLNEVENAQIYLSTNGNLNIAIETRTPILRVINKDGVSYYIDENGKHMPFSNKFTSKVIVANGYLGDEEKQIEDLTALVKRLGSDDFFGKKVQQIFVNEDKEYELVTLLGSHIVLLGSLNNLDEKLENLKAFYLRTTDLVDLEKYKLVNLKFKDQVVCTKF